MPSRRNNRNRNQKDMSKIISDNNQELELIKINVDKVKDDVSNISTFAQKQIEIINKSLEKSIKKFEELQKKAIKSYEKMSDEEKESYQEQFKFIKSLNDEKERSIKLDKEDYKIVQSTENSKEKIAEKEKKARQEEINSLKERVDLENEIEEMRKSALTQAASGKIGNAVQTMSNANIKAKRYNISTGMKAAEEKYLNSKGTDADYNEFYNAMEGFNKSSKSLDRSAGLISAAGTVLNTASKAFGSYIDIGIKRFTSGMDRIINEYEDTFSKQAVLTGVSQQEYFDFQRENEERLKSDNLENNIRQSEIMQSTADYISNGITDFSKAADLGYTSAIGKVIAPYLDQQSDAFISMSQSLGPQFAKSMMGMNKYVSENVGSSRFIQKNMNSIISMMEPMVLAANKSIMGDEEWAQMEALMAQGVSETEALSLVSEAMDVIRNPAEAIQNGSTLQAMQVANGNYTDVSSYISGKISDQADLLRGTEGLGRSVAYNEIGGNFTYLATDKKLQEYADTASKYTNENALAGYDYSGRTSPHLESSGTNDSQKTYDDLFNELANDRMQTNKEMAEILKENQSTRAAIFGQKFPELYQVIREIGPGIISNLIAFLGGKFLSGLWKHGKSILNLGGKAAKGIANAGKRIGTAFKYGGVKGAGKSVLRMTRSALSSTAARVAGGVGGAIMMAKDAYGGVQKADEWFTDQNNGGEATTGQKVSSAIGGALGGTGASVFDKDASFGDKAKNIGGGALKGAAIGTAIGGPVGTLIGGAVGAVGAAIGGERIAKAANAVGEGIKDTVSNAGEKLKEWAGNAKESIGEKYDNLKEWAGNAKESIGEKYDNLKEWAGGVKDTIGEKVGNMKDSVVEGFNKFTDFLTTIPGKIESGIEWGIDTFLTAVKNMFSALCNTPIFVANMVIGFVNGVKTALQSFAVNIANKIGMGDQVSSWFPEDMPTLSYSQMSEMPDISSYATGTDYIRLNNEMAYLHEGEAVLTKPAASLLRENTTQDISSLSGLQDAFYSPFNTLKEESRVTSSAISDVSYVMNDIKTINRDGFNLIASAISDQTTSLLFKLDQILTVISSNRGGNTNYNRKLVTLSGGID